MYYMDFEYHGWCPSYLYVSFQEILRTISSKKIAYFHQNTLVRFIITIIRYSRGPAGYTLLQKKIFKIIVYYYDVILNNYYF